MTTKHLTKRIPGNGTAANPGQHITLATFDLTFDWTGVTQRELKHLAEQLLSINVMHQIRTAHQADGTLPAMHVHRSARKILDDRTRRATLNETQRVDRAIARTVEVIDANS